MSIQAIKGVEIGDAFIQARSRGSRAHDEIVPDATGVRRLTDRAGGLEGGMTTGEPLRVRAAMKPISSLNRALSTVDVATGEPATAINQRSDVCAVPAAAVVRSEEHTSELQSLAYLVCRPLPEKKKTKISQRPTCYLQAPYEYRSVYR